MGIALFVAWSASDRLFREELRLQHHGARLLRALLRYVVPTAIVLATLVPAFA